MGEMCCMDRTGDTRTMWDRDKPDEVENARLMFERMTAKGYRAFYVKKDGEAGQRMDAFDPDAEKVILVPQLKGG